MHENYAFAKATYSVRDIFLCHEGTICFEKFSGFFFDVVSFDHRLVRGFGRPRLRQPNDTSVHR